MNELSQPKAPLHQSHAISYNASCIFIHFRRNHALKTSAERVQYMMNYLKINEQTEFGNLCGASKSVVNQWISGKIKKIDPRYAFLLEDKTPFSARWIMLGEGSPIK